MSFQSQEYQPTAAAPRPGLLAQSKSLPPPVWLPAREQCCFLGTRAQVPAVPGHAGPALASGWALRRAIAASRGGNN